MDKCLADIINDPQALKDFLRSNSQTDAVLTEADVSLATPSLDEALSSSLDYLASITTSTAPSTGDYIVSGNQTIQPTTLENTLYCQLPMGIDYDAFNAELGNGNTLQGNTVPAATLGASFHVSVPQQAVPVNTVYGQSVSISRPGVKQSVPLTIGTIPSATTNSAPIPKGSSPLKGEKAFATATKQRIVTPGTSKSIPINLDPAVQQPEAKLSNVFSGAQQAVLNNGMMTTNGQAILVPSAGGKMFIVNSPGKGNQAIALPADFLQQQQQQPTFLSGGAQNPAMGAKQLFVLPSPLQNAQGIASLNNSTSLQQLNINYSTTKLPLVGAKSEGQPSLAQGSVANTGLQSLNLLVSSQPREILPKRVTQGSNHPQHPNILPKVSINQAGAAAKALANASNSLKPRVQLYASNVSQVPNQQIQTQQYSTTGMQFAGQPGSQAQGFVANAQTNTGASTLSILQGSVRNAASRSQSPKPISTGINTTATALPQGQTFVNAGLTVTPPLLGQNVLTVSNAKGQLTPAPKMPGRQTGSPLKRGQSPLKNQQGVIFRQSQTVAGALPGNQSVSVAQRKTLQNELQPNVASAQYQPNVALQPAINIQAVPVAASTPVTSLPQSSYLSVNSLQQGQMLQSSALSSGVIPNVQSTAQNIATQQGVQQQQTSQQPQYSLLGKEGIQKLIQLYQQQGQATGQKLTSLGSLGAANLTALMQKLMYLQQQQQQTGQQIQLSQGSTLASQQLLQAAASQVHVLSQQNQGVATTSQLSVQTLPTNQSLPFSTMSIQQQNTNTNSTAKMSFPSTSQIMTNADLNTLTNLLVSSSKDSITTNKSPSDSPRVSLPTKLQQATSVTPLKQQTSTQNIQVVTSTPVSRQTENKPLLVQLPQDKGSSLTSFISTGQLTQSQLQDLQQKLLVQKINQQAQHLLPKQLITSVGQPTQAVTISSAAKPNAGTVKANVVYIKPAGRQQKQALNVSMPGTVTAVTNRVVTSSVLSSQNNSHGSKIIMKPLFSTASTSADLRLAAAKVVPSAAALPKSGIKTASSVGEIQLSPQGHQKIIVSKKIKDQLQSLSAAQKEQLLRNPKQVLVINGQKVPLAQLLQQLADEAKSSTKGTKGSGKRPLTGKEVEEKVVEEPESKVTKRLKHCLAADQARVLKPERDKPFRSAEDALSKLIPYHVYYEKIPEERHFQKDEVIFDSVAEQLLDKKQDLIDRFDTLLLKEYQRSVSTAELVMLSRLFVTDEKSLLQKDKQDAEEGKFQLHIFDQAEEESESEDEASATESLLCGEELEEDAVNSEEELEIDHVGFTEADDAIAEATESIQLDSDLDISIPNISVDPDMTQELNEATSNLLADLESEHMFSL